MATLVRVHHPIQKILFRREIRKEYPNDKILDSRVGFYYAGDQNWLGAMHPIHKIRFVMVGFTNKRIILKSTQNKVFFGWNLINYVRPFALVALGMAIFIELPFVIAAGALFDAFIIAISRPFKDVITFDKISKIEIDKTYWAIHNQVVLRFKVDAQKENFQLIIHNKLPRDLLSFLKSQR